MPGQIVIRAERREGLGKGASRRLRRLGEKAPGVLYGGGGEPVHLAIGFRELGRVMQEEAFFSQVVHLQVEDKTQACVLRQLQRHPATERVQHVDFLRIREDVAMHLHVPLHFLHEDRCVGVKLGGGRLAHNLIEVEVRCLPKDLPEFVEVDVEALDVGDSLHLSDLKLPEGVELPALALGADHDIPVVGVTARRGGADASDEATEEGAAEEADEGDA